MTEKYSEIEITSINAEVKSPEAVCTNSVGHPSESKEVGKKWDSCVEQVGEGSKKSEKSIVAAGEMIRDKIQTALDRAVQKQQKAPDTQTHYYYEGRISAFRDILKTLQG